jgi:small subunit ribosomal protein S20
MPVIKSAKKALRQSQTRRSRNIQKKKKIKKLLKDFNSLVLQEKKEEAKKLLPQIYKLLDKASKTGLLKKNTVNRRKSKLSKKTNPTKKSPTA